ncbi:MAG: hypothetical protein KDA46_08925, partial [Parvularculaceae bacterium]|nr:hypothetical protein [Parvularculaceae bacterium]
MIKNNAILFAGAVLVAFAGGVLLGKSIDRGEAEMRNTAGHSLIAPTTRSRDGDRVRRPFQEMRSADARRPSEDATKVFGFSRLLLETNGDTPRACLQFTRELDDSGAVNYGDFVRLTPDVKPAVEVAGSSLCLSGLEFDKEYKARIRAGAPAKGDERLERQVEVTIAFGDKPSYVGFAGDGVILPRLEADGIGIETVNVEKIQISVYRVSDRALARQEIVAGEAVPEDEYFYVYGREDGEAVGVKVFDEELAVKRIENDTVTTVFSLGAALPNLSPGAYFIKLKDVSPGADKNRTAGAWRWVMFTDMALTTYSSSEGVDAFVRSISTGRPITGVELELIATNNDILARVVTNTEGRARFEKAAIKGDYPLTPRMIMAYGPQEDFAALDLERAPLDLSDRDIDGRAAPSVLDAFVYLDRGIYRPGETVHVSGILRDDAGKAIENRHLTVTIRRPNGTEADKRRIDALNIGGFTFDYDVPASAPRGMWYVQVEADGVDGFVGYEQFSVEDFVPQRLEVKLEGDEATPIRPGETRELSVESRFLYGAPASGLAVEAEARLRLDPNPFPDFGAYRFGPVNGRFDERFLTLPNTTTDAEGKATIAVNADSAPTGYGAPMRADVVVGVVEPGGRVVRESARIPVRPDDAYVGLKLANDAYSFGQGEEVGVNAVLIDWQGQPVEGDLEWRLVEEDYWFDWYRENG